MTVLMLIAGILMSAGQAPGPAPAEGQALPVIVRQGGMLRSDGLIQTVNQAAVSRCMGYMVGFRNVPLRCVVGADGSLGECEVQSTNRAVLRYSRVYRCMASNVRVALPDGTPPVGRSVAFRVHGASFLSDATPPSGQ